MNTVSKRNSSGVARVGSLSGSDTASRSLSLNRMRRSDDESFPKRANDTDDDQFSVFMNELSESESPQAKQTKVKSKGATQGRSDSSEATDMIAEKSTSSSSETESIESELSNDWNMDSAESTSKFDDSNAEEHSDYVSTPTHESPEEFQIVKISKREVSNLQGFLSSNKAAQYTGVRETLV